MSILLVCYGILHDSMVGGCGRVSARKDGKRGLIADCSMISFIMAGEVR